MSRFSRKTATGLGYLLFGLIGSAGYWWFKSSTSDVEQSLSYEARQSLPLNIALGPSVEGATELSAVITPSLMHDPVVDLGKKSPTWAGNQSLVPIESLVAKPATSKLPTQYPYQEVRPVAIPRTGDAIVAAPKQTVLSLAPMRSPTVASEPVNQSQMVTLDNSLPLVPINQRNTAAPANNVAITELESPKAAQSWTDQSMQMLKDISRTLMTPPPPQSMVNAAAKPSSNQFVVAQKPVVDESTHVKQASGVQAAEQPRWRQPSMSQEHHFIVQPN